MIVDIHTHVFPEKIAASALRSMQQGCHTALFSDGTVEGLKACEGSAGIHLAVVQPVATNPLKVSHLNDAAIEINRNAPDAHILSFGAMHPACPYWEEELERLKSLGFKGVKLHPPYESVDIDDPRSVAILRKCRDLGLIVLIHAGLDVGLPESEAALPAKIRRALDAVGPLKMIAAHMGGWRCWEEAASLLADTGVCLDTAFSLGVMTPAHDGHPWTPDGLRLLREGEFCDVVRLFGADRILFGTDSPWASPAAEVEKIRRLPLDQAEIESILGLNAAKLLAQSPSV